jgi:osmoprotectant transport system permease protein
MTARSRLLLLLACWALAGSAAAGADTLRIGSKRFTESYILAQVLAQVLAQAAAPHAPVQVQVLQGLGNTAIVHQALRSGGIDLYPEYVGTIDREILHNAAASPTLDAINRQLAPLGLGAAIALGFNDGYALAMRAGDAERLGVRTLGDLARHPTLRMGLSNEFIGRADGWPGLARRYGYAQAPVALDHGLAYDAVARGQVDVIDIYTTDAKIGRLGLRVLADDLAYFPRYDAVVLYRLDVPERFPQAWAALRRLAGSIDEHAMIAMNARAELEGAAFETIARDHLAKARPSASASASVSTAAVATAVADTTAADSTAAVPAPGFLAKLFGADLARLTWQHLGLVAASVAAAALLGIPLAVWVAPHARARAVVLGATGLLQTVPSLALLAALISLLGRIGTLPALLALTLYALLPVMRNTCTGLAGVPQGLRMAGLALGMSRRDRLLAIELPLALPVIVAGLRTATAIAVGTATLAAFIGAGGYGERIVTGLALNDRALLLAGALPAAALALLGEGAFEWVEVRLRRRYGDRTA